MPSDVHFHPRPPVTAYRQDEYMTVDRTLEANSKLIRQVLVRLKYKDGFQFDLQGHVGDMYRLTIVVRTYDSLDPSKAIFVTHMFMVPYYEMDYDEAEYWVVNCILRVECHEALEFFRIDSQQPYNPHASKNSLSPYLVQKKGS